MSRSLLEASVRLLISVNVRFNVKFNVIYTGKCSSDEVQCSDYKCIPTQQVCDGIKQCEAGDDEVDCCMYKQTLILTPITSRLTAILRGESEKKGLSASLLIYT